MVDRNEILSKFVKQAIKLMLQPNFPGELFKQYKKDYLSMPLQNKGVPKDPELAKISLDYLFKSSYIKNRIDLDRVLQTEFFARNLYNKKYYIEKLETETTPSDPDLALGKNLSSVQDASLDQSDPQVIDEETVGDKETLLQTPTPPLFPQETEVTKPTSDKETLLQTPTPPLFPQETEVTKPTSDKETYASKYDPWWKKRGLKSDPFPTYDGLGNIPDDLYEDIIVQTDIIEKYVTYIKEVPTELFKNTVFYGQFGSGKTTFFEYLKLPLIKNGIYPAHIRLSAEPDYQNFLLKFKHKLCRELVNIYRSLTGTQFVPNIESTSIDDSITKIFKLIEQRKTCQGFVILIDDIYKPPDYERVALKFLNHLQTFKAELTQQLDLPNVGFFISAPLGWRMTLNEDQAYSGSVSREEDMPQLTVDQACKMLNERLAAFSNNGDNQIRVDFADQVYRTLNSRNAFTFRQFIKECLRRFESGTFDILTSNPVSISAEVLKDIYQSYKENLGLNEGINKILNSPASAKSKKECFELLIKICAIKECPDDSILLKNKMFHLMLLKDSKLVATFKTIDGKTIWKPSDLIVQFDEAVREKYRYPLNDYFVKLFEKRLERYQDQKTNPQRKEFESSQKLIEFLRKKNDKSLGDLIRLLEEAFAFHHQIARQFDGTSVQVNFTRFARECKDSLDSLSNAVASFANLSQVGVNFWSDFWHYPASLYDYLHVYKDQASSQHPNAIYLFTSYENVFVDIFNFLSDQIDKDNIMKIPLSGLKVEEIEEFNKSRSDFINADYVSAAGRICDLVENKLRDFIYSVYLLQFGERGHRRQRIPYQLYKYIDNNPLKDTERGFQTSFNEFTYLNRHQYYPIILGPSGVGYDNWVHTFSKIFAGWDHQTMSSYLNMFFQINLKSSHNNVEVISKLQPSLIYDFITHSISFICMINNSYFTFLKNAKKLEITGSNELAYFFSLDGCRDKELLQPVRISPENRKRIIESLKNRTNSIDLSSPSILVQKYGMNYREFYAILFGLINENPETIKIKKMKDPILILTAK